MRSRARTETPTPFFTAPGGGASSDRLLLISYHFPPGQAAGALRWQKLARYAAERGWSLDVITLAPESLSSHDRSRLADLPAGTRVFGVPEKLPLERTDRFARLTLQRLARLLRTPREKVDELGAIQEIQPSSVRLDEMRQWSQLTPRAAIRAYNCWLAFHRAKHWSRRAAALAYRVADPDIHRAVVSCGPPHLVHDSGGDIATRLKLPFVVDMRDPWSQVRRVSIYNASPLWLWFAHKYERRAIERAALVVTVTEPHRRAMQTQYPAAQDRIIVAMNGYDDEPVPQVAKRDRFLLAYAGAIYIDRNPQVLFRAASQVVREQRLKPSEFGIEFMGTNNFGGVPLEELAEKEGLSGRYVHTRPAGSREEALQFMASASVLVNLPQDSHLSIPSKLFEYMKFDSWLLAFAERGSATHLVLRDTVADVVEPDDVAATADVLRRRFSQFAKGISPRPVAESAACSRESQAQRLFDALEKVIGRADARPAKLAVPA